MKHDSDSGNFGSQVFPLTEAHKIAILDIRILNCDRNEENILVSKRYECNIIIKGGYNNQLHRRMRDKHMIIS